jgi:2-polyprenyl-3-methyl-5-hydroxy-6-metoxy-1,4-benzoquinol methylase
MSAPVILGKIDVRNLKWDLNDLQERDCPICSQKTSNPLYVRPDMLTVHFCSNCNSYFISPAPSEKQIIDFYENYEENYRAEFGISNYIIKKTMDFTNPLSDYRIDVINSFMTLDKMKVFDIGFGRARFLYLLKRLGADVYGNEFDPESIKIANYLGINNVFLKDISELKFDNFFDLFTLNDIVEHPLNPMELLENVVRMTKPGGLISIWTPNGSCGVERDDNLTFRVDLEHLQYFTQDTFTFVADKLNLEIVNIQTVGIPILFGIDKQITKKDRIIYKIKSLIKYIPGFFHLKQLIIKESTTNNQEFLDGDFIIFCLLRKK